MLQLSNLRVVNNEQAIRRNSSKPVTESIAEAAEQRLQHSRRKEERRKKSEEETAARLLEELRLKREASAASFEGRVQLGWGPRLRPIRACSVKTTAMKTKTSATPGVHEKKTTLHKPIFPP